MNMEDCAIQGDIALRIDSESSSDSRRGRGRGARSRAWRRCARGSIRLGWCRCKGGRPGDRFCAPNQHAIAIQGHVRPIGIGCLRRIERVVIRLSVVRPIGLVDARLNLTALPIGCNAAGTRAETDFIVVISLVRDGSRHRLESARNIATADYCVITMELLRFHTIDGVPIANLQLTQWHGAAACVDDVEHRTNLIDTGASFTHPILHFQSTGLRRERRVGGGG